MQFVLCTDVLPFFRKPFLGSTPNFREASLFTISLSRYFYLFQYVQLLIDFDKLIVYVSVCVMGGGRARCIYTVGEVVTVVDENIKIHTL